MSTLLSAQSLAYGHTGRTLGRDIDFAISSGEVLCVLGANGVGKTTLFRTLLGLIPSHSGRVMLASHSVGSLTPPARARLLAYVPQSSESPFPFSVQEVVMMGRTAHVGLFHSPGKSDIAAVDGALDQLGLTPLAQARYNELSGGERQLVLVARALAQATSLLVMDEPTAHLDVGNQALILREIARLKASEKAILFCSHDPNHAIQVADRVLLLHRGHTLALGAPRDVVTAENLAAIYGVPFREEKRLGATSRL